MEERSTRFAIAEEFKRMVRETSLSKVRVADLIANMGINRNTFYYHYASKMDVAYLIFRCDLHKCLEHNLPSSQLVYSECKLKDGSSRRLAYWTHVETGARTLDNTAFFHSLAQCLNSDAAYYRKVFNPRESEFLEYLVGIWTAAAKKDIDFILSGRPMDTFSRDMLAYSAACFVSASAANCLRPEYRSVLESPETYPYWNAPFEGMRNAIESNPAGTKENPLASIYHWHPTSYNR